MTTIPCGEATELDAEQAAAVLADLLIARCAGKPLTYPMVLCALPICPLASAHRAGDLSQRHVGEKA